MTMTMTPANAANATQIDITPAPPKRQTIATVDAPLGARMCSSKGYVYLKTTAGWVCEHRGIVLNPTDVAMGYPILVGSTLTINHGVTF